MTGMQTEVTRNESTGSIYSNIRYEFMLIVITIYSLIISMILVFFDLKPVTRQALLVVDSLNCVIFFLDFIYQLRRVKPRSAYLRLGWIDLLGSIPFYPFLRFLRVFRLLRASKQKIGLKPREVVAEYLRNRARSILLLTILLTYITLTAISVSVLQVESASPKANIIDTSDAFWWAIVTTATVGYGDYYPVTGNGKVLATFLIILGVGIFGVLASTLASWFVGLSNNQEPIGGGGELDALRVEISTLREEMRILRSELNHPSLTDSKDDSQFS